MNTERATELTREARSLAETTLYEFDHDEHGEPIAESVRLRPGINESDARCIANAEGWLSRSGVLNRSRLVAVVAR